MLLEIKNNYMLYSCPLAIGVRRDRQGSNALDDPGPPQITLKARFVMSPGLFEAVNNPETPLVVEIDGARLFQDLI
jgi:hypothetical protein